VMCGSGCVCVGCGVGGVGGDGGVGCMGCMGCVGCVGVLAVWGCTPYVRHSTDCTCCDFRHLRFYYYYFFNLVVTNYIEICICYIVKPVQLCT
jgi:hypothetical protein